jgi:hypothetical protein
LPTALPAEARSLGRFLRLLKSPQVASEALLDSLSRAPQSSQRDEISENLKETLEPLQKLDLTPKEFADRMSIAAELAIRTAFSKDGTRKGNDNRKGNDTDDDDASNIAPPMTTKMATTRAAVVSDTSTAGSEEDAESLIVVEDDSFAEKRFWAVILESIHLQVTSRTTTVWGKKKIYEIYQLSGTSSLNASPGDIAKAVEREFRVVFHGGGEDQSGCRSYALSSGNYLYIQLNIGKFYDFQDERNRSASGEKKKKKGNEFTFIVEPGSPLVAVSASRAPSKSRFTKFVLAALDAALTTNITTTTIFNEGESFQNVFCQLLTTALPHLFLISFCYRHSETGRRLVWYGATRAVGICRCGSDRTSRGTVCALCGRVRRRSADGNARRLHCEPCGSLRRTKATGGWCSAWSLHGSALKGRPGSSSGGQCRWHACGSFGG